jgi:hypothetical protein
MRLHLAELTILIQGSKGGEILQNNNLVQILARKRNPNKEPSKKEFDGGYGITCKCIAFGILVASCYAQSNNISSKQAKSDNNVTSVLTMSSS